jgi:hypothetical protein
MDVLDRYLAYSAELLRLALLGIAGYAFLLKEIVYSAGANKDLPIRLAQHRWSLIGGVVSLAFSAGFALQHRIFATDTVTCIIDHLRCRVLKDQDEATIQASEVRFNLKWSARFLQLSAVFLGLGVTAVAVTFVRVLWPSIASTPGASH